MGRAEAVTEKIQSHDYKLTCHRNKEGKLCIYRKTTRVESYDVDGNVIHFVRPADHFIMALTHNWHESGYSVDWGIEPIMQRLKSMDLWHRDLVSEAEKQEEKHLASVERDLKTKNEAFLYDFRDKFKNVFKDFNVSSMSKKRKQRIKEL